MTKGTFSNKPPLRGFIAALGIYTTGGLFWAFLPFFVGLQISTGGLTETQAGSLGSSYLIGFSIVSLTGVWWVPRINWQLQTLVASAIIIACLWLIQAVDQYFFRLLATFVMGLMMGSFWAVAYRIFGATTNPDRSFAIGIVVSYTMLAIISYAIGQYVIPKYGFLGSVIVLSSIIGLLSISGFFIPAGIRADTVHDSDSRSDSLSWPVGLALLGLLMTGLSFAAVWAFAERIGATAGFNNTQISAVIASNLLASAAGSVVASILGVRFGRALPLMCGLILLLASVLVLTQADVFWLYGLAISGLGFCVGFVLPYQMGAISAADSAGRFVVLIGAAQGFGSALGAYLGGVAFNIGGASSLSIMAATALVVSAVAFYPIIFKRSTV